MQVKVKSIYECILCIYHFTKSGYEGKNLIVVQHSKMINILIDLKLYYNISVWYKSEFMNIDKFLLQWVSHSSSAFTDVGSAKNPNGKIRWGRNLFLLVINIFRLFETNTHLYTGIDPTS